MTELPALPKQNKKQEAKSSLLFRSWIEKEKFYTAAFEMKDTRGKSSLAFSEVDPEQLVYANAIRGDKGVLLRVVAVVKGMPDYIYMRNEPSYITIKYPKCIVMIAPEMFILESRTSKRRSLLESRARNIATKVIEL
jgi:hypothetical protein